MVNVDDFTNGYPYKLLSISFPSTLKYFYSKMLMSVTHFYALYYILFNASANAQKRFIRRYVLNFHIYVYASLIAVWKFEDVLMTFMTRIILLQL